MAVGLGLFSSPLFTVLAQPPSKQQQTVTPQLSSLGLPWRCVGHIGVWCR